MIAFTVTRTSTAPIESVFDAMTDHRALADSQWMFRRSTLDREGTPAPNGAGAVRRLATFGTTFVEEIVQYERPTHWAYTLLSGAPIRDHLGTIDLRELGTGTEVSWHVQGTLKLPGIDRPMMPVFKWFIDQLLKGAITAAERRAWTAPTGDRRVATLPMSLLCAPRRRRCPVTPHRRRLA